MTMRRKGAEAGHAIGGLFTFALFGVYVLLSLIIVLIGVQGYRNVVDQGDSLGAIRTALGYVESKINSASAMEGVALGERAGVNALTLYERAEDGRPLETVIYFANGALYEAFFDPSEMAFDPVESEGHRLVEIRDFGMELAGDNLLKLRAEAANGREQTLYVAFWAGREVEP